MFDLECMYDVELLASLPALPVAVLCLLCGARMADDWQPSAEQPLQMCTECYGI
jgi:hypothetical protein